MNQNYPIKKMENLTLEQQLQLKILSDQAQNLSREQAIEYLIEMFKQDFIKKNMYTQIIKSSL